MWVVSGTLLYILQNALLVANTWLGNEAYTGPAESLCLHLETAMWVAEQMTGAKFGVVGVMKGCYGLGIR
jgi:hypothetical protein